MYLKIEKATKHFKIDHIKIKNPNEYYQKLVIHNKLKTYKDYL